MISNTRQPSVRMHVRRKATWEVAPPDKTYVSEVIEDHAR